MKGYNLDFMTVMAFSFIIVNPMKFHPPYFEVKAAIGRCGVHFQG